MHVHRIVKSVARTRDLSGLGAFLEGGRWNSEGVHALYTSENPSLALLELLVHLDPEEIPPGMYLMEISLSRSARILQMSDADLPDDWREPDNLYLRSLGDRHLREGRYLGLKVPSAVMPSQCNIVLNPQHASFGKCVRMEKVSLLELERRLLP
jgi:RES domain-containing protein